MFSIVLPVWNRAHLVDKAIDSVLAQSFTDFELIVVDDGSSDDLDSALARYNDSRLRIEKLPHTGTSRARNHGLQLATKSFVAYIDSDNQWRPTFLQSFSDLIGANSNILAAHCLARRWVYGNGETLPQPGIVGDRYSLRRLLEGNYIDINCFVHARHLIDRVGKFDESLERLIDWEFVLRVGAVTEPHFLPEILVDYHYGIAENAISVSKPVGGIIADMQARHAQLAAKVEITHDAVTYQWQRLSDRKHDNWVRMRNPANYTDAEAPGFPYILQIEPTNACNLTCELCPVSDKRLNRSTRHLGLSEFRSLLDDMDDYLLLLVLWDWGEPLLNPQFPAMVAEASRRDIRTVTSSNGHHLNHGDTARALMDAGLSTLIVAIDSPDPVAYSGFRRGGHLEQALRGLERAVSAKQQLGAKTLINMRTVVTRNNENDLEKLREMALDAGADLFTVKTLNPSCGSDDRDDDLVPLNPAFRRYAYEPGSWKRIRENTPCTRPWHMANILSNGAVVPCCYDYDASMQVGNIRNDAFTSIWNGTELSKMRQVLRQQQQSLEKCRNCGVNFRLEGGWMVDSAASAAVTTAHIPASPAGAFVDYDAWQQLADSRIAINRLTGLVDALQAHPFTARGWGRPLRLARRILKSRSIRNTK